MTYEQRMRNLSVPDHPVDVVLDTDAYNEIDDQFAIAYLLRSKDKLHTKAIYAAPFLNHRSTGPKDGMERSYDEILKLLRLMGEAVDVYRGAEGYLPDEHTPVISDAARDLAARAESYSPENPLYIIAIAAITNVASAILLNPKVAENTVVVWLGGNARHFHTAKEFNLMQDVAAARVVMGSGVPFVQLPCAGVVSSFCISRPELEHWLRDKGPLAHYLAQNTIEEAERFASGTPWTRCIWDVTAVAWLLNDGERFMLSRILPTYLPGYETSDGLFYEPNDDGVPMRYAYYIHRDPLMTDLIQKIADH